MRFTRLLVLPLSLVTAFDTSTAAEAMPAPQVADSMTPTVRWNRLVPTLTDEAAASRKAARAAATAARDSAALRRLAQNQPPLLMRVYIVLSVAQYGAVNAARDTKGVSPDAAVASASAAILNGFFPDSATRTSISRQLDRDLAQAGSGQGDADRVAAGSRLGEAVARHVLADAPAFNLVAPWKGTIPTGPGKWFSAPGIPPIGIALATARGWAIDSASQFRPAQPPAFGTAEWQAAIDEVRRVSRTLTPQQALLARQWNAADPWARWNETAIAAIRRHALSDADAARVLTVMNIAATDATVACFEAKYHYWTIRPSQADTTLSLPDSVSLPNFPSFPSGHACTAGAFDRVLGHYFPAERAQFTAIAEDQAMSRLYAGVHYRFDNDGGLALGRAVARHVVDQERRGRFNRWRLTGNESGARP
jgi:membrane-associated phospholipid phosphatase